MFDNLKKKLSGWLKGEDTKKSKKTNKAKTKTAKTKKSKKTSKKTKKSKNTKNEVIKSDYIPETFQDNKLESKIEAENEELEAKDEEEIKIEETERVEESVEPQKKGFFSKLFSKIGESKISQADVEPILMELELILLENNVAIEVIDKIKHKITTELVGKNLQKAKIETIVTQALKDAVSGTLIEPPDLIKAIKSKSGIYKIILFGINGTGKTTSVAKLAHYLKKHDISVALAAADTFRAASIEQLEIHGQRLGVPVIKQTYGADPAAVAYDAIQYAQKHHIKCIIIDTAGRMYTKENLLKEMEKIIRVTQPDLKLFVGEATTGNDSVEQARTFNDAVGIDGIVLAKADVDDKGGAALSVSHVTQKPIYFLGTGQTYDDLKPFKKSLIIDNLELD